MVGKSMRTWLNIEWFSVLREDMFFVPERGSVLRSWNSLIACKSSVASSKMQVVRKSKRPGLGVAGSWLERARESGSPLSGSPFSEKTETCSSFQSEDLFFVLGNAKNHEWHYDLLSYSKLSS